MMTELIGSIAMQSDLKYYKTLEILRISRMFNIFGQEIVDQLRVLHKDLVPRDAKRYRDTWIYHHGMITAMIKLGCK